MIVNNELSTALDTFLDVFSDWTLGDIGPHLTCTEADALANLLNAAGRPDLAEALSEGHAAGDDAGDLHYDPHGDGCDNCGGEDHACDTCPEFTTVEQYDQHVKDDHQ